MMISMRAAAAAHLHLRCTPLRRTVTTLTSTETKHTVSVSVPRFHPDGLHPERCNDEGWSEEDYMAMTQHGAVYHLPERQLRYGGMTDYYTASEETQVLQVRTEEADNGKDVKRA